MRRSVGLYQPLHLYGTPGRQHYARLDERLDYKVVKIDGMESAQCAAKLQKSLKGVEGVCNVDVRLDKGWAEVFVEEGVTASDEALRMAVEQYEKYSVVGID